MAQPLTLPSSTSENETVRVVIQARPLLPFEIAENAKEAMTIQQTPPKIQIQSKVLKKPPTIFTAFDAVYKSNPEETPTTLYKEHVNPLLTTIFNGVNATIFAYGQTSTGKSYTMKSLTAMLATQLFSTKHQLESNEKTNITIRLSFVEVYREYIRDLVDGAAAPLSTVKVTLRERKTKTGNTIFLDGAKDRCVNTETEFLEIVREGALVRQTAATGMNASSSRSHSIITISVIREDIPSASHPNQPTCRAAKLHLVDLAGSERAKRTGAGGDRFAEGVQINKGLFALAQVISTLADNSDKPRNKQAHVPYRASKLTRLLQDSLGGNSRTLLIACVSPADSSREETLDTLRYAQRARRIHNKPTVNLDATALEVSDLRAALARAKAEIAALAIGDSEYLRTARSKIASLTADIRDLREARARCRCEGGGTEGGQDIEVDYACDSSDVTEMPPNLKAGLGRTGRQLGKDPVRADMKQTRGIAVGRLRLAVLQECGRGEGDLRSVEGVRMITNSKAEARTGLRRCKSVVGILRGGRVVEKTSMGVACSSRSERPGEEEEEENEDADMMGREVRTVRQESREEQMRKTFKERLEECKNDKSQIDMERIRLLSQIRQQEETHKKKIEQVSQKHITNVQSMRCKLIENAARADLEMKTLVKSMSELSKNERGLRQKLRREMITTQKVQCVASRLRAENESMRLRLRDSSHNRTHVNEHNSEVSRVDTSAFFSATPCPNARALGHKKSQ